MMNQSESQIRKPGRPRKHYDKLERIGFALPLGYRRKLRQIQMDGEWRSMTEWIMQHIDQDWQRQHKG